MYERNTAMIRKICTKTFSISLRTHKLETKLKYSTGEQVSNSKVRSYRKKSEFLRFIHNMALWAMFQEKKILVKGQTINYIQTGCGDHKVLCFPGALGTIWSDFKPQIDGLDKTKFTVVVWDPPGYGHSRPPDRNFCPEFYQNDAVTANDFMKVHRQIYTIKK